MRAESVDDDTADSLILNLREAGKSARSPPRILALAILAFVRVLFAGPNHAQGADAFCDLLASV